MADQRRLARRTGEAAQGAARRCKGAAGVILCLPLLGGCGTMVMVGTRDPAPSVPPVLPVVAEAEPQNPCGALKGVAIAVVFGNARAGCGLQGAHIGEAFANMLGPLLGQALQALPGVGSPPDPPPTIVIQGADNVEMVPATGEEP